MGFTHLHVHTEYSLLDGSSKIKELISQTKALEMDAIAITDHGVMYGAIDFYKEAKLHGIKPILGCEIYVAKGDCKSREQTKENRENYHLVLLAKNMEGYNNIIKLVSAGFTDGFYYKPRVDIDLIRNHCNGVIALSACLSGVVSKPLQREGYQKAREMALIYKEIFKDDFYIELQDHGLFKQKEIIPELIKLAKECEIELVATNDVHYILEEDSTAHDILLCIQTGKTVNDENRLKYSGGQYYLKTPKEMYDIFDYTTEACQNTKLIADKCNLELSFSDYKLPKYHLAQGSDPFTFLENICLKGIHRKYSYVDDKLKERLYYELNIINSMGFIDYFLVTWDFIKYAKDNGIIVGPGRGSAAGSIVAYVLDITTVDPIKYNLLFERFLNPERISMPDIDIDFCYERRGEVIDYCIQKYGNTHVAQIITFGTMAARGAIRDVGRALNISYNKVDTVAKLIPKELNITLDRALKISPQLLEIYEKEEDIKFLIDMAKRLEGLPRHASTHAAGVVITDREVSDYVPLHQNDGVITTGYAMGNLEELGLLKMDFLGLRTLTVINKAVLEVERTKGIKIDINNLNYEDDNVYKLISSGNTDGIFQLESAGMKSFMKELQPSSLEDIIAGVSLYRPGPMDFIPKYVAGKHGETIKYTHPTLIPILKNTYGCIVYQEQVMEIVRQLAGYSLGRSDLLRRAMGKKKTEVMDAERKNFIYGIEGDIPGCINNGIQEEIAGNIFDEMQDFAKYAFNKSHAVAYAIIGFQTAYLKTYYPIEFMAALMSSVMENTTKIADYIDSCKKIGIVVKPPNINFSLENFSVDGNFIHFGLSAIKNVGRPVIRSIVEERKKGNYKSLSDFIRRISSNDLNKRSMESLIKAGAFDILGGNRRQYMEIFSGIMDSASKIKKEAMEGQIGLFDLIEEDLTVDILPDIENYNISEMLTMEKEVLGIYVSGHPLASYEKKLSSHINITTKDLETASDNETVSIGGIIVDKNIHVTKNGETMAFISIEDMYSSVEIIVFPKVYKKYYAYLSLGKIIAISGRTSIKEEENVKIIANTVTLIDKILNETKQDINRDIGNGELWIKLSLNTSIEIEDIMDICAKHNGSVPVIVYRESTKRKYNLGKDYLVNINEGLLTILKELLDERSVVFKTTF